MIRNTFVLPTALPAALTAVLLLSGCDFMHRHLGHKEVDYRKSAQERPLEVPPDLDTPNNSGALIVPAVGAAPSRAASTSAAPPTSALTSSAPATQPPPASIEPGVQLGGDGLHVADSIESAWARVGSKASRRP